MLTTNPHMKYIIQSPDFHSSWLDGKKGVDLVSWQEENSS